MSNYYIHKSKHKRDYKLLFENTTMLFTDLWDLVEFLLRREHRLGEKHTIQQVDK